MTFSTDLANQLFRDSESVSFNSGQKMALRAVYIVMLTFVRALMKYNALSAIFWPLLKTTDWAQDPVSTKPLNFGAL